LFSYPHPTWSGSRSSIGIQARGFETRGFFRQSTAGPIWWVQSGASWVSESKTENPPKRRHHMTCSTPLLLRLVCPTGGVQRKHAPPPGNRGHLSRWLTNTSRISSGMLSRRVLLSLKISTNVGPALRRRCPATPLPPSPSLWVLPCLRPPSIRRSVHSGPPSSPVQWPGRGLGDVEAGVELGLHEGDEGRQPHRVLAAALHLGAGGAGAKGKRGTRGEHAAPPGVHGAHWCPKGTRGCRVAAGHPPPTEGAGAQGADHELEEAVAEAADVVHHPVLPEVHVRQSDHRGGRSRWGGACGISPLARSAGTTWRYSCIIMFRYKIC